MNKGNHAGDPRGLIFESYRIEGIGEAECRTIFLDWALGVPAGQDEQRHIQDFLALYGERHPEHPMTGVLREALEIPSKPRRKGGARARRPD